MSENNPEKDPDFFNKVHLKDYASLSDAVAIIKSLVLDVDEAYPKYVNVDLVEPFYLNEHKRKMPLSTLKNPFIRRIKAKIAIDEMEEWHGVMLGGLDNKRYNQGLETVEGQSRIFLKNDGKITKFSHYGSHIGPSGSQVLPPDLTLSHIRVKPNDWTNPKTGEVREGWNGMFVENDEPIPLSELKTRLFGHAIEISELDASMKYKPVLLRGRIGMVSPVDNWIETDTLVPDLDKDGNQQYEKNSDGTPKLHPQTGVKILKEKYKREKDGVGQELKQCKYGTEEPQWIFKISMFNVDGETDNRVSVQFQQTRLGSAHILMQSADLVLEDAASLPIGGSEDPFTSLQNMWGGKEVVIAGTIISANTYQNSMWYGINGTIVMDEELIHSLPSDKVPVTTASVPEPAPEITAETYVQPAEVTYEPESQPASEPVTTPAPVAPKQMTSDEEDTKLLDRAIINAMDTMGDDIDYDMLMPMTVGIPEKFKDPLQELEVRKSLDRIRKERLNIGITPEIQNSDVVVGEKAPVEAPAAPAMKPSEKLTPDKLLEQIGAGDSDEIEVISDPDDTRVPPGSIRCTCGEVLAFGDVESHECKQK